MDDVALDQRLDRRRFLIGGAAVAGGGLMSAFGRPGAALADDPDDDDFDDDRKLPLLPIPEPIPGGTPIPGLPAPFDFIHLFTPGPSGVTLPFSGIPLEGLDVEPSTITNFEGHTALAYIAGTATGSDGNTYDLEVDIRAFEGKYVAGGSTKRGAFALI
jgi:hypothetical protein